MKRLHIPPLSPGQCRQVFVAERRSPERVQGPTDRGAAMVMGHSVKQWDQWYDLDFHARHAQQAVDAMSTWRQALLAQPQPAASSIAQLPGPPHGLPSAAPCMLDGPEDDDAFYVDIDD